MVINSEVQIDSVDVILTLDRTNQPLSERVTASSYKPIKAIKCNLRLNQLSFEFFAFSKPNNELRNERSSRGELCKPNSF